MVGGADVNLRPTPGRHANRSSLLFSVLKAIGEGFEARRVQVQDGAVLDCGPDHYAPQRVSRLLQVLTAGRPVARAAEVKRQRINVGI